MTVFDFYMAGAGTAGSCAAKLKAALQAALPHRRWVPNLLHSLAKVLVQILKETLAGNNPLGDCAADVPAVLLSLASSYCPGAQTSHPGKLLQPTPGKPVACKNAVSVFVPAQGAWLVVGVDACVGRLAADTTWVLC
jgi:hypothetical protein